MKKGNPENNICIKYFYILKKLGENYKIINKANYEKNWNICSKNDNFSIDIKNTMRF